MQFQIRKTKRRHRGSKTNVIIQFQPFYAPRYFIQQLKTQTLDLLLVKLHTVEPSKRSSKQNRGSCSSVELPIPSNIPFLPKHDRTHTSLLDVKAMNFTHPLDTKKSNFIFQFFNLRNFHGAHLCSFPFFFFFGCEMTL